jgi:hypothetical protein
MNFWRPVLALVSVRFAVARNAFERNPTAQLGSLLFTAIFALSALGTGSTLAREWGASTPAQAANSLEGVLVIVLVVLALAYAAPGSISLMGPMVPDAVLSPFPVTRLQRVVAELLACLLDVPTLLAFIVMAPLIFQFMNLSRPAPVMVTLISGSLVAVLSGLLMRVVSRLGAHFVRRSRKLVDVSAMTSLLFIGSSIALPPAFAALSAPAVIGSNHPELSADPN